jgi:GAF domain-containing protein
VGVYDDPARPLAPEDLELIQAIAEQGAQALESARLFEQTQSALAASRTLAQREQVLRQVNATINASQNLADNLHLIQEQLQALVLLDALSLTSYTPGEQQVTVLTVHSEGQGDELKRAFRPGTRLPLARSGPGWVITNDRARLDADFSHDDSFALSFAEGAAMRASGLASRLTLPLRVGGQITGTLNLVSAQPNAFDESHVEMLQPVADQIALAQERARLLASTQTALADLEATQRNYLRQQWEGYLREAVTRATGFVESPAGVHAAGGLWLPEMEQALEMGEPVILATEDDQGRRTALAVPLRVRGEPIGVLEFYDQDTGRAWSQDERALVEALADQAALALENARLFEDTQARAQREQMINVITARIRTSTDMETILKTTAEELTRVFSLSRARIRLTPGEDRNRSGEAVQ